VSFGTTVNATNPLGTHVVHKHTSLSYLVYRHQELTLLLHHICCLSSAVKDVAEFAAEVGGATAEVLNAYTNIVSGSTKACYRPAYNRGAGTIPDACGDWENNAGLCYERCRHGYYPVWFVCWQHCWAVSNEGWHDHGVTCHIPMHSYWVSRVQHQPCESDDQMILENLLTALVIMIVMPSQAHAAKTTMMSMHVCHQNTMLAPAQNQQHCCCQEPVMNAKRHAKHCLHEKDTFAACNLTSVAAAAPAAAQLSLCRITTTGVLGMTSAPPG
jgi:hypothetical protein